MNILALETSAKAASAAIVSDGILIAESFLNVGLTHSQTVLPMVESMLRTSGMSLDDMDMLAVASGPGSFTGIRIGVATVKGLAFKNSTPCVGVSTLEAMAYNALDFEGIICCVMDARRSEVYNALFRCEGGKLSRLCGDRAVSLEKLGAELSLEEDPVLLVGDGAAITYEALKGDGKISVAKQNILMQRASSVALAAYLTGAKGAGPEKLMPTYLRLSQAERERAQKEGKETHT